MQYCTYQCDSQQRGGWRDPEDSDTERNCQIPIMGHSSMSESHTLPKVHTHVCYRIQYQNSPGSILLNNVRIPMGVHPTPVYHVDRCIKCMLMVSYQNPNGCSSYRYVAYRYMHSIMLIRPCQNRNGCSPYPCMSCR